MNLDEIKNANQFKAWMKYNCITEMQELGDQLLVHDVKFYTLEKYFRVWLNNSWFTIDYVPGSYKNGTEDQFYITCFDGKEISTSTRVC